MLALLLTCALSLSLLPGCTTASAAVKELSAPEVTVTPADSEAINQALAEFGLSLLQNTREVEKKPVLLSPLSVALALSMAANGADGDTLAHFGAVDKVKFYKNNAPESLKIRLFVL